MAAALRKSKSDCPVQANISRSSDISLTSHETRSFDKCSDPSTVTASKNALLYVTVAE
jgi:hypothetical protein